MIIVNAEQPAMSGIPSADRDRKKLVELGVPESILEKLDEQSAKELLKGLFYAAGMAKEDKDKNHIIT